MRIWSITFVFLLLLALACKGIGEGLSLIGPVLGSIFQWIEDTWEGMGAPARVVTFAACTATVVSLCKWAVDRGSK